MVTATNPLLSNRTVSLLWKCRNSLLRNRHCYVTMEMQQTHYYTTVTHVTMEMQYNSLLHNRNCYVTMEMPSRPNISQYFFYDITIIFFIITRSTTNGILMRLSLHSPPRIIRMIKDGEMGGTCSVHEGHE
jgi:hypothetical protein